MPEKRDFSQPNYKEALDGSKKSDPQTKTIAELMNGTLAADYLPSSTVKNPGLQNVLADAKPRY